ncbi:MAG: histidine phosphatase family protein [Gammaproteobacteria bacterium]|nr:histidine phosphatase family protein [Gammaproteobacteria bacterium]
MPHQLLLMRHAKSSWDSDAPTDFLRPLAKRGRKAAPRVGKWFKAQGLVPEQIISSPAERARQTTLAVADVLALDEARLRWEAQIYDASCNTLVTVIQSCDETLQRVMLVGHNPGFEELLEWLCADGTPAPQDGKLLPTAAVAVLELDSRWGDVKQGSATLLDLVRARELKKRR